MADTKTAELQLALKAAQEQQANIAEQIAMLKEKEQSDLATEIGDDIQDACESSGWDPVDILARMKDRFQPKKVRNTSTGKRKLTREWVDPENGDHVYRGRGFPSWMRDRMISAGLDTESKDARIKFRDEHLQVRDLTDA